MKNKTLIALAIVTSFGLGLCTMSVARDMGVRHERQRAQVSEACYALEAAGKEYWEYCMKFAGYGDDAAVMQALKLNR